MKTKITALAMVLMIALTGCNDVRSGNKTVGDCDADGGNNCATTVIYNGKPLHCVTWGGSHGEVGLTCDYVEYHLSELTTNTETPEGF